MVEYGTAPQKCTRRIKMQSRSMKFRCQWMSQYITSVDLSLPNLPVRLLCFHLRGVALFQSVIACETFSLHSPLRPVSDEGRHKYTWTDPRRTTIPGWIHSWMKPPCVNLMWHSVSLRTWGFNISKQTDLKRLASVDSSWCHHACWMRKQWLQQCQHAQGGGKRQLGPRMWMCLLVGNYVLRAFCILTRQQGITFFINHGTCTEAPWHYNRNVKQNRRWQQMTKITYLYFFLMKTVLTTYKKQNTKV